IGGRGESRHGRQGTGAVSLWRILRVSQPVGRFLPPAAGEDLVKRELIVAAWVVAAAFIFACGRHISRDSDRPGAPTTPRVPIPAPSVPPRTAESIAAGQVS